MEKEKPREPPQAGDIRLDPFEILRSEQPLSGEEKALLRRGYDLFEFYRRHLLEEHGEMRRARALRQKKQVDRSRTSPASNTLGSCIDNAVADQIDNRPEALMIPEREETAQSAEEMTDVVSFVLYQAKFDETYATLMEDAAVTGTGVAQVFWDDDLDGGEGMASVMAWHPEDFYPDPMYEDIQLGRGCFKATRTSVAWVEQHYPHARGFVQPDQATRPEEEDDPMMEAPEGDAVTTLLEFWYKKYNAKTRRTHVHMALFAGRALLYSSETGYGNEEGVYDEGVYAHGQYPFVLYKYRDVWRKPFGTGMVYDYRDSQEAIDRYYKYLDDNARESSVQRHFIRKGSGVNPDDVADLRKTIIEWNGNDIREVLQTVQAAPLNGQVYQMMMQLTDAMKEDSGQNQFVRGEGGKGVTAASAIQALQEAGGKIARMHTEKYKAAFRQMVEQILWVLSEYMEPGRKMKIIGGWDSSGNMKEKIIQLIAPKGEGDRLPKPAYTVRVQVQKNNPLQIQADNEFLTQVATICAQSGSPLPPETVVSLMEGVRTKGTVLKALQENGQMQSRMRMLEEQLAAANQKNESMQQAARGMQKALTSGGYANLGVEADVRGQADGGAEG